MDSLRDLLKNLKPELYSAFLETWKYLEDRLLPIMPVDLVKNESLNSLPHIKNIENYLYGVLRQVLEPADYKDESIMTSYELYVILTSVALHDIGRILCEKGHGSETNRMIKVNYEAYKIIDRELATAIGNICEIHESKKLVTEKKIRIKVKINKGNYVIVAPERYDLNEVIPNLYFPAQMLDNNSGIVRVNELGALLSLIDNMDDSYRRLAHLEQLPLKTASDDNQYKTITAVIRKFIKGVAYDLQSNSVIITLEKIKLKSDDIGKWFNDAVKHGNMEQLSLIDNEIIKNQKSEIALEPFLKSMPDLNNIFDVTLPDKNQSDSFYMLVWSLINGVHIEELVHEDGECRNFPKELLISLILGNVRALHRSMLLKYKYLSRLGVPVKTWLIYVDEHLYNYFGQETFEPIFTKEYLKHVADTMWKLSTRIFGQTFFSYDTLASAASEKNLNKIKKAVKRLEIISRGTQNERMAINYTQSAWQWEYRQKVTSENKSTCDFFSCNDLKEIIDKKLVEPVLTK